MTDTEARLAAIRERHKYATKGEWESDSVDSEDGQGRYKSYTVLDCYGHTLLDAINSDAAEIHQEYDEYGCSSWDETGRRNADFIAHAHQDIPWLLSENAKLKAQLPENMQNCTIVFKECELGHGWLTATNWIQHPCPTCERDKLREELKEAKLSDLAREGAALIREAAGSGHYHCECAERLYGHHARDCLVTRLKAMAEKMEGGT